MEIVIIIALTYLLGSLPSGYLLVKLSGKDIRKIGSGNIGATNVKRALGWLGAILVFVLDLLKGALPVYLARVYFGFNDWLVMLVGLVAISGHLYPIFLGFRGGKGVSTAAGVFLIINPLAVACAFIVWFLIYIITKYSSMGSLLAALTIMVLQVFNKESWNSGLPITVFTIIIILIIIYKHWANIERLLHGQEKKA